MITATFIRQGGALWGFQVRGHAGYAASGSDIVCSAVSVATHMTYLGLSEVLGLKVQADKDDRAGMMCLAVAESDVDAAQPMLETLEGELRIIARQYPRNLTITYRERREFKCFS
ncbi:MAG: ribosomal-processing cysteine protease Prp [Clostridia bacterium]